MTDAQVCETDILARLQGGDIQGAVAGISTLPAGGADRLVLTGLAAAIAGRHAQADKLLGAAHLHNIERFVVEQSGTLDDRSARLLGQHCLGVEPLRDGEARGISIFSFPKSGSTFLETILQTYTGLDVHPMTSSNDSDGVNLDTLWFERTIRTRQITRGHLSANARCLSRCLMYDLRPVFLHRNIFDCLLSYADHFRTKYYPYPFELPDSPVAIEAAVLHMAFHYVEMYASWMHFARRSGCVLTLSYEDNRRDWRAAAERVLVHSEIPVERDRLDRAIAEANDLVETDPFSVRYNRGGARDRSLVDDATKARIRRLYAVFPGIDFSPIDDAA